MPTRLLIFFSWMLVMVVSCKKENENNKVKLPEGSISIQRLEESDIVEMDLQILNDSAAVIGLKALINAPSVSEHNVTFAADPERLSAYIDKYGDARLLPSNSWYFYNPTCRINAGMSVSDSSELNIVEGTQLKSYSTYVLPVIISSVDGNTNYAAKDQTLFIVIKTGKAAFISKDGWKILSVSSEDASNPATKLLDDNMLSFWVSAGSGMPQSVAIDLNEEQTFTGVTYGIPYPQNGGYPLQVKIEISMDGSNWEDKGTFDKENITTTTPKTETIETGLCTAKYVRFTVLSIVPFYGILQWVSIGDIGLLP